MLSNPGTYKTMNWNREKVLNQFSYLLDKLSLEGKYEVKDAMTEGKGDSEPNYGKCYFRNG